MSFGLSIRTDDGGLLINPDSKNYRLVGPVYPSEVAIEDVWPGVATHYITISPNIHPPMVFVKLPTNSGAGVSISGIQRVGNNYIVSVLAYGCTPEIYYADNFDGVVESAFGMSVYNASGTLVWTSNQALPSMSLMPWTSNRVVTFGTSAQVWGVEQSISITITSPLGVLVAAQSIGEAYGWYGYDDGFVLTWREQSGVSLLAASSNSIIARPFLIEMSGVNESVSTFSLRYVGSYITSNYAYNPVSNLDSVKRDLLLFS